MRNYIMGFIFSILLTITAYLAVTKHVFGSSLVLFIIALALIQLLVQLKFFLHLDQLSQRFNLAVFISTISLVLILVVGSLWIMKNLNYHHNTAPTDSEIIQNEAIPQ